MAVASTRSIAVGFSGDFVAQNTFSAAANASSPGSVESYLLSSGANTITPPSGAKACTIIPPSGNTVALTIKGVAGDTGIVIHLTDPTSIALNSTATFVINAASGVTVRLVWS